MRITIMKIARIDVEEITEETVKYIDEHFNPTWKDTHEGEHIHDIDAQLGEISRPDPIPDDIRQELELIQKLVNDNDCSGFMITY